MSEVVKAGMLEVTVVQAVGLDLLGSSSALTRTRRKPVVHARVTVDGKTKSGHPATRSHHPVWYPRYPADPSGEITSERVPKTYDRDGSVIGNGSSEISSGSRMGAPGRPRSLTRHDNDITLLARTRGRGFVGVGTGTFSDAVGDGTVGGDGSVGVGRGMLFDIREFYGPTRIVVELVSGPGGSSGGGIGTSVGGGSRGSVVSGGGVVGGGGSGGTVIGMCEARLAEALVRRGGGGPSVSIAGLTKTTTARFAGRTPQHHTPAPTVAPFSPIPEAQTQPMLMETFNSGGPARGNISVPPQPPLMPPQPPPLVAPSPSPPDETEHLSDGDVYESRRSSRNERTEQEVVPAPTSTAAATTDTTLASVLCASCLPKPGMLRSWRRHHGHGHGGARRRSGSGGSSSVGGEEGVGVIVVPESGSGVAGRASTSSGSDKASIGSRRPSWRARSPRKESSSSLSSSTATSKVARDSKPSSTAMTLEEAEALAMTSWAGASGGIDSAKDMWKELVTTGSSSVGGRVGTGKGGTSGIVTAGVGGSGGACGAGGPAVRLRLRFVPLWDCLADGAGPDGVGALHAAARDGDARLVISLVQLWHNVSPGSQVMALPCRRGLTPIQHCVEAGKESALRELLHGIGRESLRLDGKEGEDTALHTAVKAREEGMLRMLLAATRRSEMPSRVLSALRFGLGAPANSMVDSPGGDGLTPLALAAVCGTESMVRCLLEEGANAAALDARGMTPLAHAAQNGNLSAVRVLLKVKTIGTGSSGGVIRRSRLARMGCAPCKTNEDGMGPVALAARSGSAQVVSELIRAEVPYRTRDLAGKTPLHHAARFGHISVLRVLVAEMQKEKGKAGRVRGGGDGEAESSGLPGEVNTMMMDGGPFKISNLDLSGRTVHTTAMMYEHHQAAAFLEAAAEELEPRQPKIKENHWSSKRKPWGGGAAGAGSSALGGGKMVNHARFSTASPTLKLVHSSGSSGSGQSSGTSGRHSPLSSTGLGSGASAVDSEDLSYEYVESDRE